MPDFTTIQATSAELYARHPRLVTVAFILVVAIGSVWLFHLLFLAQPRKENASVPLPLNIQGNSIEKLEVHIYQNGQLVTPAAVPPVGPSLPLAAIPLVENGSFEQGTVGWGTGWFESYFASPGGSALMFNNAVARWYIDDQKAHGGGRALHVDHSSTQAPHKFSSLSQRIKVGPHSGTR